MRHQGSSLYIRKDNGGQVWQCMPKNSNTQEAVASLKSDWTTVRPCLTFLTTQSKAQHYRLRILLYFQLTCTKTEISYPQKCQNKGPRKFNLPKLKQHPRPEKGLETTPRLKHSRKGPHRQSRCLRNLVLALGQASYPPFQSQSSLNTPTLVPGESITLTTARERPF